MILKLVKGAFQCVGGPDHSVGGRTVKDWGAELRALQRKGRGVWCGSLLQWKDVLVWGRGLKMVVGMRIALRPQGAGKERLEPGTDLERKRVGC
jgi:hypothetical protein